MTRAGGSILVLNAGSSSLKFGLFQEDGAGRLGSAASGEISGLGGEVRSKVTEGPAPEAAPPGGSTHEAWLSGVMAWAEGLSAQGLRATAHRIVHGGPDFHDPVLCDDAVLERLRAHVPLAPLHQPHNLAGVEAVRAIRPELPSVLCFDTGFHQTLPPLAQRFALPEALFDEGVRRYGFHGLSYAYIARRLRQEDPLYAAGRIIVAHLGSGASLCALKDGVSVDTTMGMTTVDGLVMGTRCGALDPGVVTFLMRRHGLGPDEVDDLLSRRSGLFGVSGLSADMRTLLASPTAAAKLAVDLFVYRLIREIGALTAVLGGLDGLVFTAGVGENAAPIRRRVVEGLAYLGGVLDPEANAAGAGLISAPESRLDVRVVRTDEDLMMAELAADLLAGRRLAPSPSAPP